MPGLDPGIHVFVRRESRGPRDGRIKSGHDEFGTYPLCPKALYRTHDCENSHRYWLLNTKLPMRADTKSRSLPLNSGTAGA